MASYSYARIRVITLGDPYITNTCIAEIQFRESVGGPDVCTGGTPIASDSIFHVTNPISYAFDDDIDTLAVIQYINENGYMGYHFSSPKDIKECSLTHRNDEYWEYGTMPIECALEVSNNSDFSDYVELIHIITTNDWGQGETRVFALEAESTLLTINDSIIGGTSWNIALIEQALLTINDSSINGSSLLHYLLEVDNVVIAGGSENIELILNFYLIVHKSDIIGISDVMTLIQHHVLNINNSSINGLSILCYTLAVQDSSINEIIDRLFMIMNNENDRVYVIKVNNRNIEIAKENREFDIIKKDRKYDIYFNNRRYDV
jgi:hypothetical protein